MNGKSHHEGSNMKMVSVRANSYADVCEIVILAGTCTQARPWA